MVLLDWEKAFDKIFHGKLFEAMRRMGVPEKIVQIINNLKVDEIFSVQSKNTINREIKV